MLTQDWLMRQITMLAQVLSQVLAQVLGLTKAGQRQQALAAINEAVQHTLGLDLDAVSKLSESGLLTTITLGESADVSRARCAFLAALLKEAGAIHKALGHEDESYDCTLKSLYLALDLSLSREGSDLLDHAPAVEELVAELKAYILPTGTSAKLMQYYEQIGAFAKAEDALYDMIDADPDNPDLIEMGVAFYERLLGLSDAALIAGNLPRAEVRAGLAELKAAGKAS